MLNRYGRWLNPTGTYHKAPWSLEPPTRKGYARSLLLLKSEDILSLYYKTGSTLMKDFIINKIYMLMLIRNRQGLWPTNYTSTRVKKNTGIVSGFIDTRHNDGISLFMLDTYKVFYKKKT